MGGEPGFHAWDPGLVSGLPRILRSQATVFRPENVETTLAESDELSDLCGLPATRLCLFRAERLAAHEVLVRVMADLSIPMGSVYADLGVNFRHIVATVLRDGIEPHRTAIRQILDGVRAKAEVMLREEAARLFADLAIPPPPPPRRRWLWRGQPLPGPPPEPAERLRSALGTVAPGAHDPDDLRRAVREALSSVAGGIVGRRGFLPNDPGLLCRIGMILVSNGYGSRRIGERIGPWVDAVFDREKFRRVSAQERPVVMSVKGASASGKSTIRPYQRALAERTGLDWRDFAIITPDVWRKFLLDYDSLGDSRRYAGPLTGYEVEIIDRKLDGYMARKAAEGRMSHLLIDRFRFDSFAVDSSLDGAGQLLSRFGHTVYLQFMVTPPEETVERAWKRGEEVGRYKAVEDLLAHNVEAFEGIPRLFFLWALRRDRIVAFEFLDNTVPKGDVPRTIAYGRNDAMTILDPAALLDVERFRKINVYARSPAELYAGVDPASHGNGAFLAACIARLAEVRFAERGTFRVYAHFRRGRLVGRVATLLEEVCADAAIRGACEAIGLLDSPQTRLPQDVLPRAEEGRTLGSGGENQPVPAHEPVCAGRDMRKLHN